jgi:hypothetical protein
MGGPACREYRDYAKWGQDKVMPDDTDFGQSFESLQAAHPGLAGGVQQPAQALWGGVRRQPHQLRMHWVGMPLSHRWPACG